MIDDYGARTKGCLSIANQETHLPISLPVQIVGCTNLHYNLGGYCANLTVHLYPFILLGGETYSQYEVCCPRTQHNDPCQGSTPELNPRFRVQHSRHTCNGTEPVNSVHLAFKSNCTGLSVLSFQVSLHIGKIYRQSYGRF